MCRFFESRAHFRSRLGPKNKCRSSLSITATVERPRVVLQGRGVVVEAVVPVPHLLVPVPTCSEAMVPVPNVVVPVPQGWGVPVHFWYRYHTYWYRYQHAIPAGLSRISILVQGHARLSTTTSRSLMRIVFKPTLGQS